MKFLLFYSLHMIAISVRSWRRRKLFSVSKKLIGQLGSLWGQACLRTAWSPLSDVFLISSFQSHTLRYFLDLTLSDIPFPPHPCRYPFPQVWVRCAQNSTLPTFGELNISSSAQDIDTKQGPTMASDTVFFQLNQYSQILRRQCCLINMSDINSCFSLALGKALKKWALNNFL